MYGPATQYPLKEQTWGHTCSAYLLLQRYGVQAQSDRQLIQERTDLDEARIINDKLWEQILALRSETADAQGKRQDKMLIVRQDAFCENTAAVDFKVRSSTQKTFCDVKESSEQKEHDLRLSIVETPQTEALFDKAITSKDDVRRQSAKVREQLIIGGTDGSQSGGPGRQQAESHKTKMSEGYKHTRGACGSEYEIRAVIYLEEKCKLQKKEIARLQGKLNEFTQTQVRYLDEKRELQEQIAELRHETAENERRHSQKEKQWRERQNKMAARIYALEEQILSLRCQAYDCYYISSVPAQQKIVGVHIDSGYAGPKGNETNLGLTAERLRYIIDLQSERIYQLSGDLAVKTENYRMIVINGAETRNSGGNRETDRRCVAYDGMIEFDALGTDASVSEEFLGYSQGKAGAASEF